MKFNLVLESENLEEDIDKIVKTLVKAFKESEETTRSNKEIVAHEILGEKVYGLDQRVDSLEGRLDKISGTDISKRIKSQSEK